ncbi:MAG: zinc ribbon domain-containing protein [Lachnospiraceae bacterium]|nr:zinc ribbon domain-containing protein [Lachnospiraceae bacterium]
MNLRNLYQWKTERFGTINTIQIYMLKFEGDENVKCTECGREIEDNKKFCKYCGALVKPHNVSEQKAEQMARCKACGAVLKPGTAFCTQCGTPISQAVNTSAKAPLKKPGKKGKKAGKIVIGVMTFIEVLLVAFIGYYFANQDGLFDQKESRRKTELISDTTEENTASYDDENENVTKDVEDKNTDESVATSASLDNNVIDVDQLVLNIREKYNKIRNGIDSNSYDTVIVNDGVMAYSNQKQLSAIVVKKNYACSNYIS